MSRNYTRSIGTPAYKLGRKGDYAEPDQRLVADAKAEAMRQTGKLSVASLMRTLSIGQRCATKLMSGGKLPLTVIDEIDRNLHHREDGSFRVRLLNMLSVSRHVVLKTVRKLQFIAEIVERYRDVLHVTGKMSVYWSLPPKSVIREMCQAIDHSYAMLVQIHRDCPELDRYVFKLSPKLYEEITKGAPKPRKSKARRRRKAKSSKQ